METKMIPLSIRDIKPYINNDLVAVRLDIRSNDEFKSIAGLLDKTGTYDDPEKNIFHLVLKESVNFVPGPSRPDTATVGLPIVNCVDSPIVQSNTTENTSFDLICPMTFEKDQIEGLLSISFNNGSCMISFRACDVCGVIKLLKRKK